MAYDTDDIRAAYPDMEARARKAAEAFAYEAERLELDANELVYAAVLVSDLCMRETGVVALSGEASARVAAAVRDAE